MKRTHQQALTHVNNWNAQYPEGTHVIVTRDNGEKLETVTRSEAWEVCGCAVVMVKGISGGYDLSRVKPVELRKCAPSAGQP